jgi:hypothetical protein
MAKRAAVQPAKTDDPLEKIKSTHLFASIINELNVNQDQLLKRQVIIGKIEKELSSRYNAPNRMISYIIRFGHPKAMIHSSDITAFDSILSSVTHAQEINILLHGPGGDGSIVEKMIEMCRGHLPMRNGKLRVIVPNIAKSAATVFALGADSIIMGYCSELGPIDPQVLIVNSGVTQQISALAFVESRDSLMEKISEATKKKEPTTGLLTQLAGLNIPFTQEMANLIHFAENTATRLLDRYMLKEKIKNDTEREKKAKEIAGKLLSKELFPIHGHFINAKAAKDDLGLEVDILDRTDWKLIWDYYIRSEIQMMIPPAPDQIKTKLFESSEESIISQESAK